jgi:hypothetical protein
VDPRTERLLAARAQAAASAPATGRRGTFGPKAIVVWLRAHFLVASVAVAAMAVGAFVAYSTLITLPAAERQENALNVQLQQETEERAAANQAGLEACLAKADVDREALWRAACQARKAAPGCALPQTVVTEQNKRHRDVRNECLRQFSLETP